MRNRSAYWPLRAISSSWLPNSATCEPSGLTVVDEHGEPPGVDVFTRRLGEPLEQRVLGLGIERRRRLIEYQQQRRIAHEPASQCQLLPLTEADFGTFIPRRPELRVDAVRQSVDDILGTGTTDSVVRSVAIVDTRKIADTDGLLSQ